MTAELLVEPMAARDVRDLAWLHRQTFPFFFLSTLSEPFLVLFYRGFLQDETAVSVVARDEDDVTLGAVVGTSGPSESFVRLLAAKGADEAFLTTDAIGNDAVNGFYKVRGWTLTDTHQTREGRPMNGYTKRLDAR